MSEADIHRNNLVLNLQTTANRLRARAKLLDEHANSIQTSRVDMIPYHVSESIQTILELPEQANIKGLFADSVLFERRQNGK